MPECPSNIFRYISDEYAEQTGDKTPHTHRLYVVKSQTSPESGPYQIISMVCIGCRYHFVLEVDDVKLEASPCGKNRKNRPLHHFVWADSDSPAQLAKEDSKYYPIVARERFACSAPACTTELTLRVTRPRIAFRHTQILRDLERVKRRMEEAKRDCPGRFQELSPQWARSAVGTLHAYIRDVIDAKPEDEPRKIAKWNRRFYVQFGPECDSILKYLEFTPKTLDDGEDYWILPTLDPRDDITRVGSRRAFFEDVRHELFGLTVASQPDEAIKMLAARPRIERDLHADDYPRTMSNISNYDARDFALLGAMPDFSEALLAYAYRQEHRLNKARGQELFSAFKRVVQGRGNYDLEMFIASQESIFENEARQQQQAASLNQGGDDLLWQAYSFFRLPSDCDETDEFIINAYNVQVEASPKQKDTARECLAIIGRHRKSDKILAVAQGPMDLQEATAYLEVDLGWAPENIVQWSMVQVRN